MRWVAEMFRQLPRLAHIALALCTPAVLYFVSLLCALLLPYRLMKDGPIELLFVATLVFVPLATAILCLWCVAWGLRRAEVPPWLWGSTVFCLTTTAIMLLQVAL